LKKNLIILLVVALLFAVLVALGLRGRQVPSSDSQNSQRPEAPDFALNLLGGGELTFPEGGHRPAVLNFMASW
jgi:hypothetical protein